MRAVSELDYFARRGPAGLVFGSFFALLLPLLALRLIPNFFGLSTYLAFFEATVLGTGHFFITLALYFQSSHLDHFRATMRNRVIFFAMPAAILVGVALLNAVRYQQGAVTLYFFSALRFADFLHVGRQGYGMLQLFKRAHGALPVGWLRRCENAFFVGTAALQWVTFAAGGRFPSDNVWACAGLAAVGLLGAAILVAHLWWVSAGSEHEPSFRPLGYFAMQAFAGALSVYRTELYVIGLTLHYVEYHVIMAPRCFRTPLDDARGVDRVFGWLRRNPLLFYAALMVVVLLFELREQVQPDAVPLRFLVHLFDGIFLLHYFVEAFLWKFGDARLRATLAPLYFARAAPESAVDAPVAASPSQPVRAARTGWLLRNGAIGLGTAVAVFAVARLGLIDSLHARQHRRWGIDYARNGRLLEAERHLSEAAAHAPKDVETRRALQWVQTRLAGGE